ncbi:putative endo-1,3(4)-beta-glucanase, partial [Lophiotrema nucula]
MPSSSLFLRAGAILSALSSTALAGASLYEIEDSYQGSSFLEGFDFFTETDPTHGFVRYQDQTSAANAQLVKMIGNDQYIGVDYQNTEIVTNNGDGRASVRISTKQSYTQGLFVVDIKHMPGGICGTWPAFWSLGSGTWPQNGEIDIIEGVNRNSVNKFVLHTDTQCSVDGTGQTDPQNLYNCALDSASGASGCDVNAIEPNTYGSGFNANGGGVYAVEWTDDFIKMWFFPRGSIPASITAEKPDVSEFGTPNANFQGDCDISKKFLDHKFIFDTTFCGDWAGNVYAQSGCPMYSGLDGMASCKKFVAENPAAFSQAYWRIGSFKTFQ